MLHTALGSSADYLGMKSTKKRKFVELNPGTFNVEDWGNFKRPKECWSCNGSIQCQVCGGSGRLGNRVQIKRLSKTANMQCNRCVKKYKRDCTECKGFREVKIENGTVCEIIRVVKMLPDPTCENPRAENVFLVKTANWLSSGHLILVKKSKLRRDILSESYRDDKNLGRADGDGRLAMIRETDHLLDLDDPVLNNPAMNAPLPRARDRTRRRLSFRGRRLIARERRLRRL